MLLYFIFTAAVINAQTTEFSYQGRLADTGQVTTGNFDFEFRLFDAETGGTEIGSIQRLNVPVAGGIFSVKLDFGANFNGQPRFLEIGVRPAGGANAFTILAPRQSFTSTPYAIQSLKAANAAQLGGVDANQFIVTNDPRLNDERNPAPNSPNYIQNTTTEQPNTNFNISGNGLMGGTLLANSVFSRSGFFIVNNFGLNPVLNIAGTNNLFVGSRSGESNTTGTDNAFVGANSGAFNTTGSNNSFFGRGTGNSNVTGDLNSFFGSGAGQGIRTGSSNTFLGAFTFGASDLNFATAVGSGTIVRTSNTVVLGRPQDTVEIPGTLRLLGNFNVNGTFSARTFNAVEQFSINDQPFLSSGGGTNIFAGIGAGINTFGNLNTLIGQNAGRVNTSGSNNTIIGANANVVNANLNFATAIGAGASVSTSNTVVLGRTGDTVSVPGSLSLSTLGAAGVLLLCRNAANLISPCSSSLRYKTDINPFNSGLTLVQRLRPITFTWKDGGAKDFGLGAEEVAAVEPLLVTYNSKGEVEGVKYDRLGVVLLNAVKEQQTQLEKQNAQIREQADEIKEQRAVIENLKQIVCGINPAAKICK